MKDRMRASVQLATVFIVIIMGVSIALTFTGERDARFAEDRIWSVNVGRDVQSLQVIDLDGDRADDLFVQSSAAYAVFDASGETKWTEQLQAPTSTTMGDLDGDGDEDVAVFQAGGRVHAVSGGSELWSTVVEGLGGAQRAAVIRFSSGTQLVLGDDAGRLVALRGGDGTLVWDATLSGRGEVRGLDDAVLGGDRVLIAADRGGFVAAFDGAGRQLWSTQIGGLRRMRSFDLNGDGRGEALFGGEEGTVFVHGLDGARLWTAGIGQQVVELRDGELDGDPSSREVAVGGRRGGVFAFSTDGALLWSGNTGARVSDIAVVDLDDDGIDETVVGDERGALTVFAGGSGDRFRVSDWSGGVLALEPGVVDGAGQLMVAGGGRAVAVDLTRHDAPFFYTPLLAGLLLSLAIAGVAVFVGGLPEPQADRVVISDGSPDGLLARRRMLFENISDVEQLRERGELEGPTALAKLEELRRQLAETNTQLRQAGVTAPVETVECPNCGGRVRLGRDRCDYCGEVVIA